MFLFILWRIVGSFFELSVAY